MTKKFISKSVKDTHKHAANLAEKLKKNSKRPSLVVLVGELGVGKSEWARGFIQKYISKETIVNSPTFSVINPYSKGRRKLFHVDLYRLSGPDDLESVGFWDLLIDNNVVVVEWGDRLPEIRRSKIEIIKFKFECDSKGIRQILS